MFLKRNRRTKNGETYEYWSLVETVRTERGPRHRLVANLGIFVGSPTAPLLIATPKAEQRLCFEPNQPNQP
jgi:hypothetical protein